MLRTFIVYFADALVVIFLLTQVVVPMFVPKLKFFWFFRKESKEDKEEAPVIPIGPKENPTETKPE